MQSAARVFLRSLLNNRDFLREKRHSRRSPSEKICCFHNSTVRRWRTLHAEDDVGEQLRRQVRLVTLRLHDVQQHAPSWSRACRPLGEEQPRTATGKMATKPVVDHRDPPAAKVHVAREARAADARGHAPGGATSAPEGRVHERNMVGVVTRRGGLLDILPTSVIALVTTMLSAFEPVSVTPWSASAPHAHGRDVKVCQKSDEPFRPLPTPTGATLENIRLHAGRPLVGRRMSSSPSRC